ncbi:MAG: hypothetical protein J7L88_01150 [Thermoplasmata archaeon]|nr:hypothetical protein [Thermoplasmata archaeon]
MLLEILLGMIINLLLKQVQIKSENVETAIFRVWKKSGLSDKVGEFSHTY